jgi:hypothetical protein
MPKIQKTKWFSVLSAAPLKPFLGDHGAFPALIN